MNADKCGFITIKYNVRNSETELKKTGTICSES